MLLRSLSQSLKIVSVVVIALLIVLGSARFFTYWVNREQPATVGRPVTIEISKDDDTSSVAKKLTKAKLIRYGWYFEGSMRLNNRDLQPGYYTLRHGMSVNDIINQITVKSSGDANATQQPAPKAIKVTFIEGQRLEEYAAQLQDAGLQGGADAFMKAVNDPTLRQRWDFLKDLPKGANLQGYLFPDTYTFGSNASAADVVNLMLANFDAKYTPQMRKETAAAGMTIHEVVTVASIVEREAVVPDERPVIARVYLNRLDEKMILNADPTVQYAVGKKGDWWPAPLTTKDLETDSPYNTYKVKGLPPGPISNPGLASIQAVIRPADVNYLYFVAKNDGSNTHAFTADYEQQKQNLCTYLKVCGGDSSGNSDQQTPPDNGNGDTSGDQGWRSESGHW